MIENVLINADDFGWTDGHNQAVDRAYRSGSLRRASLLSNGKAFDEAVELTRRSPELKVGVHLTVNEGSPLLDSRRLPHLTASGGNFYDTVQDLAKLWLLGRLSAAEVIPEWRAQIERSLRADLPISHLDSHKHVHVLPPLLDAMITLAREYGIEYARLPLETWTKDFLRRGAQGMILWMLALRARGRLRSAGLVFADHFFGISLSGEVAGDRLRWVVTRSRHGLTEIMLHPAVITPDVAALQKRYGWAARYRFEEELKALCSLDL